MTSAWQSCQGDYKPLEVFTRDNLTVVTKNVKDVGEGLYQWDEYAMPTEVYESVIASTQPLSEKLDSAIDNMFPEWNPAGYEYFAGEKVTYKDELYRCIQSHTSQSDWTPDVAVSLWVNIADPSIEWPEWKQPTGAHDAYAKGDKVSHNDKHWVSDIDANVYEPGVYGWTER